VQVTVSPKFTVDGEHTSELTAPEAGAAVKYEVGQNGFISVQYHPTPSLSS
jgi:hypothetical protein